MERSKGKGQQVAGRCLTAQDQSADYQHVATDHNGVQAASVQAHHSLASSTNLLNQEGSLKKARNTHKDEEA
jgi:hypothetical protein